MTDISETLIAKSDQINAADLMGTTITVTVKRAVVNKNEHQPVTLHTIETPGRAYRPNKTMRRLIAEAWGTDSSMYEGRSLTLYRNPDVIYGGDKRGGIEISHMSHIEKPVVATLMVGRGKTRTFTIQPLQVQAQPDWQALIAGANGDRDALLQLHSQATSQGAPQQIIDTIIQAGQQATQPPPQEPAEQSELGGPE